MKSLSLIFPGQGSQYEGMGKSFYSYPEAKNIFDLADRSLQRPLTSLCFEGKFEELSLTQNTQPCIFTVSMAMAETLRPMLSDRGLKVNTVLGHSVGEYAALTYAGVLDVAEVFQLVEKRGKYMQEAVPVGTGKMMAILKVEQELIEKACSESSTNDEHVVCANFNQPQQVVISGHKDAVDRAVSFLKSNHDGPMKAIELPVSAPFHSPLMLPAQKKMAKEMEKIRWSSNKIPYIPNITGSPCPAETSIETLKNNLINQISGSVLWTQSIMNLPEGETILEVGPGKTLTNLVKRIRKDIKCISLDGNNIESVLGDLA